MMNNFLAELRSNARLRWGVALIVAVAWLYGVLLLRDELADQTVQHRSASQAIDRLNAQLAEPDWAERASAARALKVQMEGRLWQAATSGLAQAAFQDWLTRAAQKAGINNPQITIALVEDAASAAGTGTSSSATTSTSTSPAAADGVADTPPDLWKIRARLSFEHNPTTLLALLLQMEMNDNAVVVNTLTARKEPTPRAEMEVFAYFQRQAAKKP